MTDALYAREGDVFKRTHHTISEINSLEEQLAESKHFQDLSDQFKNRLDQTEYELKIKEEHYAKTKQACEQLCSYVRKSVTCPFCNKIYTEPVDLPCAHTVCRHDLHNFVDKKCTFCKQIHDISIEDAKLNANISHIIALGLHFTEEEKALKHEIDGLFNEIDATSEKLKNNQAEIESYCVNHFTKLTNQIYLTKEELKTTIENLAEKLIDQLNISRVDCENDLNLILWKNVLSGIEETKQLENRFREELKSPSFQKKELDDLKSDLTRRVIQLNEKQNSIFIVRNKIDGCSLNFDKINEAKEIFFDSLKLSNLRKPTS